MQLLLQPGLLLFLNRVFAKPSVTAAGQCYYCTYNKHTLPGTNMEVDNGLLENHFPLQTGGFPLPC